MLNDNDLIERYLYAITRRLPAKQRADVAEELRTLISDMLDERCGNLPPTAKDVRVVLTELGTPGEVVRKYTADEDACLIGQPYYAQYLYVLKIVLACVAGGMLDDLPPVPRESKNPARGDAVAGIVFSIVGAIVFLLFPDVLNALSHRGDGVPFDPFNTEAIRSSAWVIIAWTVVCIGAESFKLVEGRYTPRLLVVTLASDLVVAALAVFWLTNFQLVDSQAILQAMQASGAAPNGPVLWAVSNAQTALRGDRRDGGRARRFPTPEKERLAARLGAVRRTARPNSACRAAGQTPRAACAFRRESRTLSPVAASDGPFL